MALLPFVVEPRRQPIVERIGSDESGVIEVERRGYLTTGEKAFVQQVQQFDNGTTEIVTVSRRVARKYSLGMDRAYNLVLSIISGGKEEEKDSELISKIEEEFAEDLTAVVKGLSAGQAREDLVLAACMIRYRINNNFDIGDIAKVHPDLVAGLANLYRQEDSRSLEGFETEDQEIEATASVEEVEKKHTKATKSHSRNTTGS